MKTSAELIEDLDSLPSGDSEILHSLADTLILEWMAESKTQALRDIAAAYERVKARATWWATA